MNETKMWVMPELDLENAARLQREMRPELHARSEETLKLEYEPLENYPELLKTYEVYVNESNLLRARFGLPPFEVDPKKCRLIDSEMFDGNELFATGTDSKAFYDNTSDVIYVRFDKEEFKTLAGQLYYHYVIGHETVHQGMEGNGIHEGSFPINEGITELINRRILQQHVLSDPKWESVTERISDYLMDRNLYVEGFVLMPEDLISIGSDGKPLAYSRKPEMVLVDKIEEVNKEAYEELLKAAYLNKSSIVYHILFKYFGIEVAENFRDDSKNLRELFDLIDNLPA